MFFLKVFKNFKVIFVFLFFSAGFCFVGVYFLCLALWPCQKALLEWWRFLGFWKAERQILDQLQSKHASCDLISEKQEGTTNHQEGTRTLLKKKGAVRGALEFERLECIEEILQN